MLHSGSALKLYYLFHLIGTGYADNFGVLSKVNDVLRNFNCPLKLTISTCSNLETTLQLVRLVTASNFRIKVVKDTDNISLNTVDKHQEVLIVDLKCKNTPKIFEKINPTMLNFYKIVVYDSSSVHNNSDVDMDTKVKHLFKDTEIMPMSQVFYILHDSKQHEWSVKQVYRVGTNEPLVIEEIRRNNSIAALTPALRRTNLRGLQLNTSIVILNNDTLNHLDDYRDIHIDTVTKAGFLLTNAIISFANATVKYSFVDTWGYQNKTTGKWNGGMVGQLIAKEADIGATVLFFTEDRIPVLEFISSPTPANGGFIFRAPQLSYTDNIYLLPFDRNLWLCLFGLVLFLVLFLSGAVFIEMKIFSNSEDPCRVSDAYMIVYGAVVQQGASVTPISTTGRIIMAITFIILMFLFVSYSANIVALLQSPSNKIKTLQDLYESKIEVSVMDIPYNRYFFPLVNESLRKKFFEDKLNDKDGNFKLNTLEDGMKKVREGQHGFYTEYSKAYKIISETFLDIEKCGLQDMTFFQMKLNPWYVIRKNSSYNEILKIGMKRLHEHGIQQRENLRLFLTKPKCLGSGANFASATLIDTSPAILILLWGMLLTFVVFICEIISANSNHIQRVLMTYFNVK